MQKLFKKFWAKKLTFGGMVLFFIVWDLIIRAVWQGLVNYFILSGLLK